MDANVCYWFILCSFGLFYISVAYDCFDAYSCWQLAINTTQASENINCYGFKSCSNSPSITNMFEGKIYCDASYSCFNSEWIETNGERIECQGYKSCSNVSSMHIGVISAVESQSSTSLSSDGTIRCRGDESCSNTNIFMHNINDYKTNLLCTARMSCANSIINAVSEYQMPNTPVTSHYIRFTGYFSGYNASVFIGNDSEIKFGGFHSGYQATVVCESMQTCFISCVANGCFNTTFICEDEQTHNSCVFDVFCEDAEQSSVCPSGYDGINNLKKRESTANIQIIDLINSITTAYPDNPINTNSLQCNDYQACILLENYTQLTKPGNTSYTPGLITVPVDCNGRESCFFTNIVFKLNDIINYIVNDSYSSNISSVNILQCDGFASCDNITYFVGVNESSLNIKMYIRFRGSNVGSNQASIINNMDIINNSTADTINILCTGHQSCQYNKIKSANNVYCDGSRACFASTVTHVQQSVYVRAEYGLQNAQVSGITQNVICQARAACNQAIIANVSGSVFAVSHQSANYAKISNINGGVFGLAQYALQSSKITNVAKVYCAWRDSCEQSTIRSVALLVQAYTDALKSATIISDMKNYTSSANTNTYTMTVKLYARNDAFSIHCNANDTCRIGCFQENSCKHLDLYCYGYCLVDCDDGSDYQCPTIKFGTYSVWKSANMTDISVNGSNSNQLTTNTDRQTGKVETFFGQFVSTFMLILMSVSCCLATVVCGWRCICVSRNNSDRDATMDTDWKLMGLYFCNVDFCIFFIVFGLCIFLGIICILYGFGQINELVLSNYWCDKKDLDTIRQHSIEFQLNQGTSEGCWKSTQFTVDTSALFESSRAYSTTPNFQTLNIIKCAIWLLYGIWFIWMASVFISHFLSHTICGNIWCKSTNSENQNVTEIELADVISSKTRSKITQGKISQPHVSPTTTGSVRRKSSFRACCPCCFCLPHNNKVLEYIGDTYFLYLTWYRTHFGEDTRNWFILLSLRELMEITLQTFAAYQYNGLNIVSPNEVLLAFHPNEVKLFCLLLCINCILTGILWLFYVFCHKLCHGMFFKQLIFFIDTIFDTFYALFPIIIVSNQNGFNWKMAVAALKSPNVYVLFPAHMQYMCEYVFVDVPHIHTQVVFFGHICANELFNIQMFIHIDKTRKNNYKH